MTRYTLMTHPISGETVAVRRDEDGIIIPYNAQGNVRWHEFEAWRDEGNTPAPAAVAEAPLRDISDRQFFQVLAMHKLITHDEALAAVKTGEIPAIMRSYVDQIKDADEQFAVRMLLSGATSFERHHPLIDRLGEELLKLSPQQIDDLWRQAITL